MQNDELLANVTEVAGSKVLPPCVILARIGQGGMGAVYRARHLNLDIDVAVKVLKPQLVSDDPLFVQRFRREGQSAAKISHQNVIRVYDVAENGGLHYIIMELVVGESARQRVERKGPLPVGEALALLYEAALGLGEAHRLGLVHRDIKPDNLLVSHSGQVKVADLGLAKPTIGGNGQSMLSSPNQIMGTPSYMPPEQWETTNVSAAADVWALGATLHYLLAGEDAITDPERIPARIMRKILLQPFPDIRQRRPEVPAEVAALIQKATSKEPGQRFLDAGEMAAAIDELPQRRTSLRDRAAGTTEARTMVSPPPLKNLEQIKQWLREDFLTRAQTPSGLRKERDTDSQVGPRAITPDVEGTIVQATPRPMPRSPDPEPEPAPAPAARRGGGALTAVVAALLLGGGGFGAWWTIWREPETSKKEGPVTPVTPPVDPFAEAKRLEGEGNFAGAIAERRRIEQQKPELNDANALGSLLVRRAEQLAEARDWSAALTTFAEGIALAASPSLTEQQQRLRQRVIDAARPSLVREAPLSALLIGAPIELRARLEFAALTALRFANVAATRVDPGVYSATLTLLEGNEVPITATLVDGSEHLLETWRIERSTPIVTPTTIEVLEAPVFVGDRVEGFAITNTASIKVRGRIADVATFEFEFAGKKLDPKLGNDSFEVQLPVTVEGEATSLELKVRKAGVEERRFTIENVVKLTSAPEFTILEPVDELRTDRMSVRVRVGKVGPFARKAVVSRDGQEFPLLRDKGVKEPEFVGDVPLNAKTNRLEVTVFDLANNPNKRVLNVTCTIEPAAITSVTLEDRDTNPVLTNGELALVRYASVVLRPVTSGTRPVVTVGDVVATAFDVTSLQEGQVSRSELRVRNELGEGVPFVVQLLLDTTDPTLTLTTPAKGAKVDADAPLRLTGTYDDANGVTSIETAAGAIATMTPKDDRSGNWTLDLPAPKKTTIYQFRVRDRAGNVDSPEFLIEVAPPVVVVPKTDPKTKPPDPPPVQTKTFAGFATATTAKINAAGYPDLLVHATTGATLVAIGNPTGRPSFYAAVREISAKEYSGDGGNEAQVSVSGDDITRTFLKERGQGLDLPTEAEWDALVAAREPRVINLTSGKSEWLKPARMTQQMWPIRKAKGETEMRYNKTLPTVSFRVVFRP